MPYMCPYKIFEFILKLCLLFECVWKAAANLSLAQLRRKGTKCAQVGQVSGGGSECPQGTLGE